MSDLFENEEIKVSYHIVSALLFPRKKILKQVIQKTSSSLQLGLKMVHLVVGREGKIKKCLKSCKLVYMYFPKDSWEDTCRRGLPRKKLGEVS